MSEAIQPLIGHLGIEGIEETIARLTLLNSTLDGTGASLIGIAEKAAGAALIVSGVIASLSIQSAETAELSEKLYRSLGGEEGIRVSETVRSIAEHSQSLKASVLVEAAEAFAQMTGNVQQAETMARTLDRLALGYAITGQKAIEASQTMAEMANQKVASEQQLRQLMRDGIPIQEIARKMGLSGYQDLVGMNSNRIIAGIAQFSKTVEGAGSITVRIQNIWESIRNSLASTGKLLVSVLGPFLDGVHRVLDAFLSVNEKSHGFLGLGVIVGTVIVAFNVFRTYVLGAAIAVRDFMVGLRSQALLGGRAGPSTALAAGALGQGGQLGGMLSIFGQMAKFAVMTAALERLAPALQRIATAMAPIVDNIAARLAPALERIATAMAPIVDNIAARLAPVIDGVAAVIERISGFFEGWGGDLAAAMVVLASIQQAFAYIKALQLAEMMTNIVSATVKWIAPLAAAAIRWVTTAVSAAATAAAAGNFIPVAILAGAGILIGGAAVAGAGYINSSNQESGGASSADRPHQRSSWENVYYRQMQRGLAAR